MAARRKLHPDYCDGLAEGSLKTVRYVVGHGKMVFMIIRLSGLYCLILAVAMTAPKKKQDPVLPAPSEFLLGRHTFFDFGPPFDFYEVFSVQSGDAGTSIQRITLTPPGNPCTQPATVETAAAQTT